jgi:hypothetical protein
LVLDSIGADTQINLRTLPPAPVTITTLPTSSLVVGTSSTGASSVTVFRAFSTTTTSTASPGTTLEALQSTTVTSPYGVSTTYLTNGNAAQTLTAVSGEFKSAGNIVEPLPSGQPIQTVPPAPPGIIIKVNHINGDLKAPINPQKDARIFGYDATTDQVVRFSLDLDKKTAKLDSGFPAIPVPGAVPNEPAGLDLAWDGKQRVLLVSQGSTIYAYNPVTAAPIGQFTTTGSFIATMSMLPTVPITMIAGTDTLTVLGTGTQLYAIDLPSSLQTGVAQVAAGNPPPISPLMQFALLGGLTSAPGTNTVFATIAGHFDTTQPGMTQLGIQAFSTAAVMTVKGAGSVLSNALGLLANTGVELHLAFVNVPPPPPAYSPGPALGSIDQSLALVTNFTPATAGPPPIPATNTVSTETDTYTFTYPDPLEGLSQTFRPDLYGSALIDIQGTVQSIRGRTATGMVLNDTGNLNLVKFRSVRTSTIIGQPVSHIQIQQRSDVLILTKTRAVGGRNDVKLNKHLKVIGPLSQPNDMPFPPTT